MSLVPQRFFNRPATEVARDLIGMQLVRRMDGKTIRCTIVETEAYGDAEDKASHARFGRTKRNWPMFESGGTIYVYFTYGMHWLINISTGPRGTPSAVLLRGAKIETADGSITLNGPAKLTKYLRIDGSLTGTRLGRGAGIWIETNGTKIASRVIKKTPRIGVDYAGVWAKQPWRFSLQQAASHAKSKRKKLQ